MCSVPDDEVGVVDDDGEEYLERRRTTTYLERGKSKWWESRSCIYLWVKGGQDLVLWDQKGGQSDGEQGPGNMTPC